ncbi:zinc finger, CCHC-type containing protein [Tanacetum coccineum]
MHAHEMLKELKTLFAQQAEQELLQTVLEFYSCKQEEEVSVSSYNYNMHSMRKTINELHAMLKLHEQTLPKNNAPALHVIRAGKGKNKLAYAPKPKIPPPPKREDPTKDSICHQCGETRHWKRNCPQYLAELLKNKKLSQRASGSGIFTIELYTFPNKSWVYDTGCGTHIYNATQSLRGSRKLKPGALSLYVGNGQRATVEAIRSFHLSLPSGLVIVLNNFHYAPSITRGIISVSRLYDDGYVNRFVDNSTQVSKNNMVYFSAVLRDGIFEINLCDSYTNVSSIYTLSNKRAKSNLDSALLWHCRLGHISKKRIEKLQHDGLLNSTHLRAFEKCGCEALVKQDTLTKPDKLEPSSVKCIFIGYPKKTIGYSFYYPPENKVLVARNAEFLKNSLITQEASGSLEDLKIIQEEDTHPSIDTSLHHEEDDLEVDEPQSDIIPIRRSIRTQNAPNRMCLYIDTEEHELRDLGEPANYKAALLDPDSDK